MFVILCSVSEAAHASRWSRSSPGSTRGKAYWNKAGHTYFQGICVPTRPFLDQQTSSNTGALACVGNSIDFYLKLIWGHHARNSCNSWPFFRVSVSSVYLIETLLLSPLTSCRLSPSLHSPLNLLEQGLLIHGPGQVSWRGQEVFQTTFVFPINFLRERARNFYWITTILECLLYCKQGTTCLSLICKTYH